jgi:DNA-binding NtrC family response regulator
LPERYRSTGTAGWIGSGVRVTPPLEAAFESTAINGADINDAEINDPDIHDSDINDSEIYDPAQLAASVLPSGGIDLKDHLCAIEIGLIRKALVEADGTVAEAARLLRIRRTTLVEKLRKYRLSA